MGKLSGSYEAVVRGVSEQAPQNRRSGQHFAQVNMISDPVRGLARRHGSILQDETTSGIAYANWALAQAGVPGYKTIPFFVGGVEYDLVIRTDASTLGRTGFCWAFNKVTRLFIPVVLSGTGDTVLNSLISGGASAWVNVGRYVFIGGNTITPTSTNTDVWGGGTNKRRAAVWIRSGAYSRTYSISVTKADGTVVTGSYTTVSSSYPGTLDTSDIPLYIGGTLNPDYQKQINDRVNEYNGNVTKWIGTAAFDITPENIAQKLVDDLVSKGINAFRQVGHVLIAETGDIEVAADDGGDQSLMVPVGQQIDNVDLVTTRHYVGKVVKVVTDDQNADAIYLRAYAEDGISTGYTQVVWKETAGYIMTPSTVFCIATVENGTLYLAGGPAELQAISGVTVPTYKANTVGDDLSAPLPEFFGKRVDYLGVFQDRLVIGSGATLKFSRPGDYFNWFRKSVATDYDDDPWEGFALGSEDDTIKWSTTYDRNLLLYGKRFQYSISGRQPFTPKTASIVTASSFEDATDAEPKATGNYVVYAKWSGRTGKEVSSLHQVQAGVVTDSPESYNLGQQLDTYLQGKPVEILTLTSPNLVMFRTDKDAHRVYTYSYLDGSQQERLFDSWSFWEWSNSVGQMIGLSKDGGDILIYMLKAGKAPDGTDTVWVSCELFARDTNLSDYPYMDSLRPFNNFLNSTKFLNPTYGPLTEGGVAVQAGEVRQFVGMVLDRYDEFQLDFPDELYTSWVGIEYESYVTPTNPYAKDRNGAPILSGRLTLGIVKAAVSDTGGAEGWVTIRNGAARQVLDFGGRVLSSPDNLVGRQPITNTTLSIVVGGEVRECSYTIKARTWLPLTITSLDWTGQHFYNTRRA